MGSTDGGVLDVGLGYGFRFPTRTAFDVRVGSRFATEAWMESYYGVSIAESLRSGIPFYDAEAGFKDISLSGNLTQDITDHWSLLAYARIQRLTGDADESPVSRTEMQGSGGLGVAYTF
jgi:outer membrane protein